MLTHLRLKNFKSWEDTGSIKLAPITGFFGPNSSGKSSLLQALLLLKQTANSSDRKQALQFGSSDNLVDLGDFSSLVRDHAAYTNLSMEVAWERDTSLTVREFGVGYMDVVTSNSLQFMTVMKEESRNGKGADLVVSELQYNLGSVAWGMRRKDELRRQYELYSSGSTFEFHWDDRLIPRLEGTARDQGIKTEGVSDAWPLPEPYKCYGFPDEARAYYENAGFLADLELALEDQLSQLYYLGPNRVYPQRSYQLMALQPSDVGKSGEQSIEAIISAGERGDKIFHGPKRRRLTLEEYVATWLVKLRLIVDFKIRRVAQFGRVYQVIVKKTEKSPEVLLTDVGFGVSQILPVLVQCFYAPEGSTIILEHPENHLHPAVQAGLADVLIDAHKKRKVQIIVESHSEHLLRRLQRRIADEELDSSSASLYFCDGKESSSEITSLDIDEYGNIRNWPKDFFGDQFTELAETQKSRIRRMKDKSA